MQIALTIFGVLFGLWLTALGLVAYRSGEAFKEEAERVVPKNADQEAYYAKRRSTIVPAFITGVVLMIIGPAIVLWILWSYFS